MQAAVMRDGEIVVDEIDDPVPGPGQVLVETIACGICGSDLHCLRHAPAFVETSRDIGMSAFVFDTGRDLVMGHEFSARVLEPGPDTADLPGIEPGAEVVAFPAVQTPAGVASVGYSNDYPGGYGERMVLDAPTIRAIPNGLDPVRAALTEPVAVGLHAVNQSGIDDAAAAIVVGCGPVGLTTIAALRHRGVPLIVAADFSPKRRELAEAMGATVAIDPREEDAVDIWRREAGRRELVIFEAVGVPGMIDGIMRSAPRGADLVIVGVCMETDEIFPLVGISKELTVRFVLGWTPEEFEECLAAIAEGRIDVAPLITAEVGLDGVAGAFETLANPSDHAKIVIRPGG